MNTEHKLDTGTAQNLNSLLENNATNNIGYTTKENVSTPDYLDRLAADHVEAGLEATAADIKAAAAEIRKLQVEIGRMANAQSYAADREAQLSAAIFGLIEDHVQTVVENEVQQAIDDYDPTDHHNFSDAVAEQTADTSTESIREAVADVIKNGYFDVTFSS